MPKKILVVDDEPDLVEMIKARLQANNYEVVTACDGKEGLEKAGLEKPDLIILDIMMPQMDGMAMAEALKQDDEIKGIPIIFLTCLAEKDHLRHSNYKVGDNIFLAKPFEAEELLMMIDKIISAKR